MKKFMRKFLGLLGGDREHGIGGELEPGAEEDDDWGWGETNVAATIVPTMR